MIFHEFSLLTENGVSMIDLIIAFYLNFSSASFMLFSLFNIQDIPYASTGFAAFIQLLVFLCWDSKNRNVITSLVVAIILVQFIEYNLILLILDVIENLPSIKNDLKNINWKLRIRQEIRCIKFIACCYWAKESFLCQ